MDGKIKDVGNGQHTRGEGSPTLRKLYETTKIALLTAGEILRKGYFGKRLVHYKTPTSPVTQTDLASEKKILSIIRKRFPDHTFLAEESAFLKKGDLGPSRPDRYRWIIDPLDGTINFLHRIPQFCVSIAVEKGGQILVGGIYDPCRKELFLAQKGGGATLNGRRIQVSKEKNLKRSILITGFPYDREKFADLLLSQVAPFLTQGIDIRRFGAAALDLAWVACGRAEAFWEYRLNSWDVAAGVLLVEEAGGKVTNFRNQPLPIDSPRQTLATNGLVHQAMVKNLYPTRRG